jgi:hypothetical protein
LAAALGTTAADLLPASPPPDAAAVLREQCRRLFEALVRAWRAGDAVLQCCHGEAIGACEEAGAARPRYVAEDLRRQEVDEMQLWSVVAHHLLSH